MAICRALVCAIGAMCSADGVRAQRADRATAPFSAEARDRADALYGERYRPQYHFTPPRHWMNDPNGMVFYAGEFHLFYQYNPVGNTWGHMSWGHAVSPDLVRWRHLPLAIPEVDSVMAFSGSVVVDHTNSSGFGRDGTPPLVALYTGHRTDRAHQSQYLAHSLDRGRTWQRYARNPVLDLGLADFRDPKVFWDTRRSRWVMVTVKSPERKVALFASPNLRDWTHLSDFGPTGAVGGIWECPDLFELPVAGGAGESRWVMIVNLNPGAVAGGSGAQYFIGEFDGTHFTPDPGTDRTPRWADYGADFYAAVTWSDIPPRDGRRLWLGWMNNWSYAEKIPTAPWRSAQSLPRSLTLVRREGVLALAQSPVRELATLRSRLRLVTARQMNSGEMSLAADGIAGDALELDITLALGTAREAGVQVRVGEGEATVIGVNAASSTMFVDRRRSGDVAFHADVAARHEAPIRLRNGRAHLRVFVDRSSVEVFADSGRAVITDQIFPKPESVGVTLFAVDGAARMERMAVWRLRSIWR
jgi:fructan beta-fructosidase